MHNLLLVVNPNVMQLSLLDHFTVCSAVEHSTEVVPLLALSAPACISMFRRLFAIRCNRRVASHTLPSSSFR